MVLFRPRVVFPSAGCLNNEEETSNLVELRMLVVELRMSVVHHPMPQAAHTASSDDLHFFSYIRIYIYLRTTYLIQTRVQWTNDVRQDALASGMLAVSNSSTECPKLY